MRYIILLMLISSLLACNGEDNLESVGSRKEVKNIYPTPPSQWMGGDNPYYSEGFVGDLMPYYDNGSFYLYFLHDATTKVNGKGFHDIHLFKTEDAVEYEYEGQMIAYGDINEADFAIGTGSVAKQGSTYYFYYTGHNGNESFVANNPRESVLCATSNDLMTWNKVSDFKLTAPSDYYNYDFRDPHVFFNEEEQEYWMLMSTQVNDTRKAVVLLFTTSNLESNVWEEKGAIYEDDYIMLECADLFKMGDYWYLLFSENWSDYTGTRYRIADSPYGPWRIPEHERFDGEFLYAAKTAEKDGRRYLFGWTARRTSNNNGGEKLWAGNIVCHELHQKENGELVAHVPASIEASFSSQQKLSVLATSNLELKESNLTLGSNSNCRFGKLKDSSSVEFTLKDDNNGVLNFEIDSSSELDFKIAFDLDNSQINAYLSNNENTVQNTLPVKFTEKNNIKIVMNNDVCVVYLNGEYAFSNRIYGIPNSSWILSSDNGSDIENIKLYYQK